MKIDEVRKEKLNSAVKMLMTRKAELVKKLDFKCGESAAPLLQGYVEDDPLRGPVNTEWVKLIEPENSAVDRIIREILADAPKKDVSKFTKLGGDNLWVWGGPTPYWGGSMADDTLVRGADYFNAENVVYVYGPTNEEMLGIHSKYKKMLCQINSNCRSPGAQDGMSDAENAEKLSRFSLEFPNIVGAMCDDVTTDYTDVVRPEKFNAASDALKKHNRKLKMYGVVYVHELACKDFSLIQPYMDVVNLWFWSKHEILEYDEKIELCRKCFPGKPIIQGIFLHEYGISDTGNLSELLAYQLDKSREYMTRGIVEGVIILGDREIKKWPVSAATVKNYLNNQ